MAVQSKLLERPLADFNGKDWPKFRFNMEVRCEGIGTTFLEAFTDTVNRKKTACVVWGAILFKERSSSGKSVRLAAVRWPRNGRTCLRTDFSFCFVCSHPTEVGGVRGWDGVKV